MVTGKPGDEPSPHHEDKYTFPRHLCEKSSLSLVLALSV